MNNLKNIELTEYEKIKNLYLLKELELLENYKTYLDLHVECGNIERNTKKYIELGTKFRLKHFKEIIKKEKDIIHLKNIKKNDKIINETIFGVEELKYRGIEETRFLITKKGKSKNYYLLDNNRIKHIKIA